MLTVNQHFGNRAHMYLLAATTVFSILLASQVATERLNNASHGMKDIINYFIDVENAVCNGKNSGCGPKSNNSFSANSCCGHCSCDETTCDVVDSCCVETLGKPEFRMGTKMTCQYPQLRPFLESKDYPNSEWHYKMFTKCPDNKEGNIYDVINKCEQSDSYEDITTKVPVTDEKTRYNYKNQYCAYCHNVSAKDLLHWDVNLQCFKTTLRPKRIGTVVKEVLTSNECNLIYLRPELGDDGPSHECRMVISTCNVTGLWEVYDADIEAGCAAYSTVYEFQYRNVFCYLCNSNASQLPDVCSDVTKPTVYVDFTAILQIRHEDKSVFELEPRGDCSINQIYDPVKKICREIECLFPKTSKIGTCVNLVQFIGGVTYGMFVRFTIDRSIGINARQNITFLASQLQLFIESWLYDKIEFFSKSVYIYANNVSINETDEFEYALNHFIVYIEVDFNLLFPKSADIIDYLLAIPEYLESPDNNVQTITFVKYRAEIDLFYIDFTGASEIRNDKNQSFYLILALEGLHNPYPKTILTVHYGCPLIRLTSEEYGITQNPHTVHIKELNAHFNNREVLISTEQNRSGFSVLICVDTFIEIANTVTSDAELGAKAACKAETYSSASLLSLVCTIISISFSVLTVIVYSCFKELKTQPGVNNIILCLTLIVAQSFFQFGSGQSCNVSKAVCQGIGIFVHFSWLFLIFWMNTCCIHLFRVFRLSRIRVVSFNKLKTTFIYFQYSFTASLTIILTTVTVSLSKTEGKEIGYGGSMCYIQSGNMVAYLFTLPVGLVILVNIILFLLVIVQMRNSSMDQVTDRLFVYVYAKLSTLTGFTWAFGFLSFFFNVSAFDYMFIILNASQGVFVFFAFVANRRTLRLLLKRKASQAVTSVTT